MRKWIGCTQACTHCHTLVTCPVAQHACYEEGIWILQHAMLGTKEDMRDFASAIKKIQSAVLKA